MVALEPAVQTAVPEIIEAPAIRTVEIAISGMRWQGSWGGKVSKALAALPWVEEYSVELGSAKAKVNADYDEFKTIEAINSLGFEASIK